MNPLFFIVIGLFFLLFSGLNFYIGLRGWQILGNYLPGAASKLYWLIFWLVALAYICGRVGLQYLPGWLSLRLTLAGAYWLAAMYYLVLSLVGIDIVRLLDSRVRFLPMWTHTPRFSLGLGALVVLGVLAIVGYGAWNAKHPKIQHYNLTVPKHAGSLKQLHIVMVSDIHLGLIVGNKQLKQMVELINGLKPDIIVMPGDVIDESVEPFVEQQMANYFRSLRAKYGVYSSLGNHEYIGGHADQVVSYMQQAGVRVLRDEVEQIAGSFYLIGREDSTKERFAGSKRLELGQLVAGLNMSLPVLVLDHQPNNLKEAAQAGVDLQLSGHTHRGQMFPNQLITSKLFEDDWGYLRKGPLQVIVSSGFGTWGPPVRTGSSSEIVDITVSFQP